MAEAQIDDMPPKRERMLLFNTVNSVCFCENVLFCQNCDGWLLSVIYIHPYKVGAYLCGTCVRSPQEANEHAMFGGMDAAPRCLRLEDIMGSKFYPCKNFRRGCGVAMKADRLQQHEAHCDCGVPTAKDFNCLHCDYTTQSEMALKEHYEIVHRVRTVQAHAYNFNLFMLMRTMNVRAVAGRFPIIVAFVKCQASTLVLKIDNYLLQMCDPLESLPNFHVQFHCAICKSWLIIPVLSNWNQLNESIGSVRLCTCFLFGCFSISVLGGLYTSHELQNCCNFSFSAKQHIAHINSMHDVVRSAFITRSELGMAPYYMVQYINVNGNIFGLYQNKLKVLYWCAGNYGYTYYVFTKDPRVVYNVYAHHVLTYELPDAWVKIYIAYKQL